IVPLATPARRATSSSRVAAKPRAENSSSAAARIASRRAAVFCARLTPRRDNGRRPGPPGRCLFEGIARGFCSIIGNSLTDQSVIRSLKPFVHLLFTRLIRLRPLGFWRHLFLTSGGLLYGVLQVGRENL